MRALSIMVASISMLVCLDNASAQVGVGIPGVGGVNVGGGVQVDAGPVHVGTPPVVPRAVVGVNASVAGDRWRYVQHNNTWWYWMPDNYWMTWGNNGWQRYYPGSYSTYYRGTEPIYSYGYPNYSYSYRYPSYGYNYVTPYYRGYNNYNYVRPYNYNYGNRYGTGYRGGIYGGSGGVRGGIRW